MLRRNALRDHGCFILLLLNLGAGGGYSVRKRLLLIGIAHLKFQYESGVAFHILRFDHDVISAETTLPVERNDILILKINDKSQHKTMIKALGLLSGWIFPVIKIAVGSQCHIIHVLVHGFYISH